MPGLSGPGGGQTGTVADRPVRPARLGEHPAVQPLRPAALDRGSLRPSASRLRGTGRAQGLRGRRLQRRAAERARGAAARVRRAESGPAIAGLRLRASLLSFRALRSVPVVIRSRLKNGKVVRRPRPRRLRACRIYQLRLRESVVRASIKAGGRKFRVKRGSQRRTRPDLDARPDRPPDPEPKGGAVPMGRRCRQSQSSRENSASAKRSACSGVPVSALARVRPRRSRRAVSTAPSSR